MIMKFIKNKNGQAIVELAIILPVLLIILFGIFEFGRVMNVYLVITSASREGARIAAVGNTDSYIVQKIQDATSTLDLNKLNITISPNENQRYRGEEVLIRIGYDIDLIVPIIQNIVPNPLHLETETIMRVE